MKKYKITLPTTSDELAKLKAGDKVEISGVLYTGRDAAHKRLVTAIENGEELPFNPEGQGIYYVGPAPSKPGQVIGSCGPTTSYRMDDLTIPMLEKGLKVMIGKGQRNQVVIDGIVKHGAVYLAAIGGAGALISEKIVSSEVIAYSDLGTEAVRKLEVKDFPVIVVIDSEGSNMYDIGREKYKC